MKFVLGKNPYCLDKNMLLDLGGNLCYVKRIYPKCMKLRRCEDVYGFLTRNPSYPLQNIFEGNV